jgi:hypothetical protein
LNPVTPTVISGAFHAALSSGQQLNCITAPASGPGATLFCDRYAMPEQAQGAGVTIVNGVAKTIAAGSSDGGATGDNVGSRLVPYQAWHDGTFSCSMKPGVVNCKNTQSRQGVTITATSLTTFT